MLEALLHLIPLQSPHAVHAEVLDVVGGHHRAADHRPPHGVVVKRIGLGQVAHHAAGEAVPGSRGVHHILQREGRGREHTVGSKHGDTIFATLDDDRRRPHLPYLPGRPGQRRIISQHTGFRVVDHQHIHVLERGEQFLPLALDPEVHGVGSRQIGPGYLMADLGLQHGVNVGQKQNARIPVGCRQHRIEILQHVEVRFQCAGLVEIVAVLAFPAKRLPGDTHDTAGVDVPLVQRLQALFREILSDHRQHAHRRKKRGGDREVSGRTAQRLITDPVGSLDRIKGDGSDDNQRHQFSFMKKPAGGQESASVFPGLRPVWLLERSEWRWQAPHCMGSSGIHQHFQPRPG